MVIQKSYAIGKVEGTYSQGIFKDLKTGINQSARAGEFLFRLEDDGKAVKAVKIRRWDASEGEWVKLLDEGNSADDLVDPLTKFHRDLRKPVEPKPKSVEFTE